MELLEQLEQRINALLAGLDTLAEENSALKQAQAQELNDLAEENHSLREELLQERQRSQTALTRIEAILQRIKERDK